jgi:hypothetical protein
MRKCRATGSERGMLSNGHPYRNRLSEHCRIRSLASEILPGIEYRDVRRTGLTFRPYPVVDLGAREL